MDFSNVAAVGYNTAQESLMIERLLPDLKPHAVMLFFTQENDQWTNASADYFLPRATLLPIGDVRFDNASRTFDIPWYQNTNLKKLLDQKLLHGRDFTYLLQRGDFALRGRDAHTWRLTEAILRKIHQDVKAASAQMIVVDVPGRGGVLGSRSREGLLRDTCAKLDIPYYNLRDYYPPEVESLYLRGDSHWSVAGHAFVAEKVEEWLGELGLLPICKQERECM